MAPLLDRRDRPDEEDDEVDPPFEVAGGVCEERTPIGGSLNPP